LSNDDESNQRALMEAAHGVLKVRSMPTLARNLAFGAGAGAAATAVMSALMLGARSARLTPQLPPALIAEEGIEEVTQRPAREVPEAVIASIAHFAFGAAAGAVFAGATSLAPRLSAGANVGGGVAFGSLVWLVSYQGWVPALGIMPPASRDDPGRVATMLVAHWVYGAALGGLLARQR
jgi:hypothetical protein